jgi:hypothetical protein
VSSSFSSSPEVQPVVDRLFATIPIVNPIYEHYRAMVAERYPHPVV